MNKQMTRLAGPLLAVCLAVFGIVAMPPGAEAAQDLSYTPSESGAFTWDKTAGIFVGGNGAFSDNDNVTFAESDFATDVAVPTNVVAGKVEIHSGYVFTGSPIRADSVTKKGEGASSVGNDIIAPRVSVERGTFRVGRVLASGTVAVTNGAVFRAGMIAPAMKFLRLTVTAADGGVSTNSTLAEFRMYRETACGRVGIVEWPSGTKLTGGDGQAFIYPGGSAAPDPASGGEGTGNVGVGALIDGIYPGCGVTNPYGADNNDNGWVSTLPAVVTIEFPAPIPAATGCNLCGCGRDGGRPTSWTIETSADGEAWQTVSEKEAGAAIPMGGWQGGDACKPAFPITPRPDSLATVAVEAGSVLIADGDYIARLAAQDGAVIKGVTNGILAFHTLHSTVAVSSNLTVDLTAYDSRSSGDNYILVGNNPDADNDATNWPPARFLTVTGADTIGSGRPGGRIFRKDKRGYYVTIPARKLVWHPVSGGGGAEGGTWEAGFGETPWTLSNTTARTFFRNGDSVAFGDLGDGAGLAAVNVSGEVKPGDAAFPATAGGTAYLFQPATGAEAKIVLTNSLAVSGTVTNRVPWLFTGLSIGENGRLVMEAPFGTEAPGTFAGQTVIGSGAALVFAAASGAQTVSGKISGGGDILKEGAGEATLAGEIAGTGMIAVKGGKLSINAKCHGITATEQHPVNIGPGAAIRFEGGNTPTNRLPDYGWLLCNGGRVELYGRDIFPIDKYRPCFAMTNSTLFLDFSYRGSCHRLKMLTLADSEVVFDGREEANEKDLAFVAGTVTVSGNSRIYYADGANQMNKIRVKDVIDVCEGGRLDINVQVKEKTDTNTKKSVRKTGPGTLVVSPDAVFNVPITVEEGTLKIPADTTSQSFRKDVAFKDDTTIDVSDRLGKSSGWGKKLKIDAGDTVNVDVSGREIEPGERLLNWKNGFAPDGGFKLVGAKPCFYGKKTGDALIVAAYPTMIMILP